MGEPRGGAGHARGAMAIALAIALGAGSGAAAPQPTARGAAEGRPSRPVDARFELSRIEQVMEASIIGTHAYQFLLARRSGKGDASCYGAPPYRRLMAREWLKLIAGARGPALSVEAPGGVGRRP